MSELVRFSVHNSAIWVMHFLITEGLILKKKLIMLLSLVFCLSLTTLNASAISLSEKEDIYRVDEFTGNSLDKEFVIQWLMEDDNFIYHLHETSNSEKYVNRFLEGALTGINITGELISGNVSAAFEVKDDYYNAIKDILLSYSTNEKILDVEDAKSKIRLEYYTGFTENLIKYGLTVPEFASLATELKGVKVTNQLETIDELYKEFENAVTGEGQQQLWSLLDEYVTSAKFSEYLSDASEVVSYASKGLEIAQFSYDLFIELETYNTINSQLTDVLQYLYQNSSSADVKKVAGELWVKSMSSKKENLQDAVNQVYAKIGEVGGETAIEVGIGIVASKLKVSSVLASAGLGITFGNLYSDLAFSTSDIREQLTFIEATNEISTVLATALQSKLNAYELRYPSSLGSYEERAKDAKDIILYSKLLLQTRRMGEKAYYTLKETAWDSAIVNNADGIIALLGLNKFEKIEDWYASCCADFETAERILYSEIDVSMYQNLYEYPEENEDFEIVDGRLIAYYGSDSHPCVPYEVHTIGSEAFNAEVLMTQLTIRGTTMESRSVSNCGDLYSLYIPKSVTTIQNEAIYNCPNVTIYGYTGTTAETYAKNNNIPFHSLGISTPDDGMYVNSYTLSEGTLNLDGQTMYVGGDFLHTGGKLKLGSGKLVIFGDYHMTNEDSTGFGSGCLSMENANGHLVVYGDYIMGSTHSDADNLSAGTLEIKGDFTQWGDNQYNFYATGTHTVILSGSGEQEVSFDFPQYNHFQNLKVTNTSGKVKFDSFSVNEAIIGNVVSDYDMHLYDGYFTLSEQTIKTPNLIWHTAGSIVLGNNAKIDGNLIQTAGTVKVVGNSTITGNYHMTNEDSTGFGSGCLSMENANGHLVVYGDYIMGSTHSDADDLSAGTLEIKGDFTQWGTNVSNFSATGTHTIILSGTGKQTIYFAYPQGTRFNILVIKNVDGVDFVTAYRYNELQTIYPFDFEVVEYNEVTNQINVDVIMSEDLQSLNGNVIISLYDGSNKLIECRIKELSELEPQTFNGLNDYDGNYIVKAFYWADMTSIKPLCPSIQKELATK